MSVSNVRSALRAATQLAAAAALVAVVATQAQAQQPVSKDQPPAGQGGGRMGGGGNRMMQMMMEGITLSDAQKTRVDSIAGVYREKMMALPRPEQGTPPSEEQRAARMKLQEEQMAAIKSVLTADQAKTFDANMANMRSRMGGGGGRPPAGR